MISSGPSSHPADTASTDADPLALYLHIPFCTAKCGYCDFNSYEGLDHLVPAYTPALVRELELWAPAARQYRVETVFFGGGTPSLTAIDDLRSIVTAVREEFDLAEDAEWTLEANPSELTREHLGGLRAAGINRLSMGVQSLHDDELQQLDRLHSSERAIAAFHDARAAGFDNVNLDLIYGLIDQPFARWQATLERALELGPEHLSCYALTIEPGTALYYQVAKGELSEPDPDAAADMYEWTRERLAEAGYRQYEISNWARPGLECRHNLVYWRAQSYLGLGAGAHSFFAGNRLANIDAPSRYVEAVDRSYEERTATGRGELQQVASGETPNAATNLADALILGLRLIDGIEVASFEARFDQSLEANFGPTLAKYERLGLLDSADGRLRLTERGLLLSNELFVELLPDPEAGS